MNLLLQFGIVLVLLCKEKATSLRLSKVSIPSIKYRGESVLLECHYELNNNTGNGRSFNEDNYGRHRQNSYLFFDNNEEKREAIYSVKWYKDNEEFYRFVPKATPKQHSYKVDGIKIDHQLSDNMRVFLKTVTLKSSGLYRCEISAEAPSFASVQGEGHLEVVFLPTSGPHILGEEKSYQTGGRLSLNCTSGKSSPASKLQWYINDEPILNPKYIITYQDVQHQHGLLTSSLGLSLKLDKSYFENGPIHIKCVASISPVLWTNDRESVLRQRELQQDKLDIPLPSIDNREAMFLIKSNANPTTSSIILSFLNVSLMLILHICRTNT